LSKKSAKQRIFKTHVILGGYKIPPKKQCPLNTQARKNYKDLVPKSEIFYAAFMFKTIWILVSLVFIPQLLSAEELYGIIIGKYAHIRNQPTVVNTQVVTKAYQGTALKILDKTQKETSIESLSGHWYKVRLIEEQIEGWVFDKYVALEGSIDLQEYFNLVLGGLYYFRPELNETIQEVKTKISKPQAFTHLPKHGTRFLNYIGYFLMAQGDALAFPVLIEFMNPDYKDENSKDANYAFTWEILERLTPNVLITNNYKSFKYWWEHNWSTIKLDVPAYKLATIFKKIQENEDRSYRNLLAE